MFFRVQPVCPMCCVELPPGPRRLHEEAGRRYLDVLRRAGSRRGVLC